VQYCCTTALETTQGTLYLRVSELSLKKSLVPGHLWSTGCGNVQLRQMIVGTGVDIAEVPRIKAAVERFGQRFLSRVFTLEEARYCLARPNAAERLAARFAAKEAAMKALGTGLRHGVTWHDVEVVRESGGRPTLRLTGKAAEFAARLGCRTCHVSITHTVEQAMAFVILES
jgi:holo-[acyl-carrier protein] synthase